MPVGFPDYYGGLTLPVTVAEGGTGQTSVTAKALLYGAGTSKLIETNVGTAGQVLQIDSVSLNPTFENLVVDVSAITGILAVAHGGTGTATPALVAGFNITITGTWPNNTIAVTNPPSFGTNGTSSADFFLNALTGLNGSQWGRDTSFQPVSTVNREMLGIANQGIAWILALDHSGNLGLAGTLKLGTPLAVAYGGTGTAAPALVAGTAISITGTWPNNTITNTSAYASLADPLAVAHGGTGTATPALVAGFNITITGAWPNNTIALTNPPTFGTNGTSSADLFLSALTGLNGSQWGRDTSLNPVSTVNREMLGIANQGVAWILALDHAGNLGLAGTLKLGTPLAVAYGGTGAASLLAAGVPQIVATVNLTGQTASIGATTLYTPAAAAMYRVSAVGINISPTATSSLRVDLTYTANGVVQSLTLVVSFNASTGTAVGDGVKHIFPDASTAIQYDTSWTSGGAGDKYDLHIRLEAI